ncbi:MAG: hypothetical protein ACOX2F_02070 [bacterium]
MNAVFDPSLIFISDTDWQNTDKQDEFLENLLCHLETIDKYDICSIYFSNKLQEDMFEHPGIHPWYGSDFANPLVSVIYKIFFKRLLVIESCATECSIVPDFLVKVVNNNVFHDFLKLSHSIIDKNMSFFLCLSAYNKLLPAQRYKFSCNCGHECSPELINTCNDWINTVDVVGKLYPSEKADFVEKMEEAIVITQKKLFKGKSSKYPVKFTNQFMKDLLEEVNHREKTIESISKRLTLSNKEAGSDNQLKDEYIRQKKERRFRVTNSTRIHYKFDNDGSFLFLRYFGEGKHDDGL